MSLLSRLRCQGYPIHPEGLGDPEGVEETYNDLPDN